MYTNMPLEKETRNGAQAGSSRSVASVAVLLLVLAANNAPIKIVAGVTKAKEPVRQLNIVVDTPLLVRVVARANVSIPL